MDRTVGFALGKLSGAQIGSVQNAGRAQCARVPLSAMLRMGSDQDQECAGSIAHSAGVALVRSDARSLAG